MSTERAKLFQETLQNSIAWIHELAVIRALPDAMRELWPGHIVKTARLEEHRPVVS